MAGELSGYFVKQVGRNRGKPRIWLEHQELATAGFKPGDRYEVRMKDGSVILSANPDGSRVVSAKPARREGDAPVPVIDLNSEKLLALFAGMAAVRLVQFDGQIHLMPLAAELRKKERTSRLLRKLENDEPLSVGSLSHGAGFMTHSLHEGLQRAGLSTRLAFANDIRPELLQHASQRNDAWSPDTIPLAAPMQELAFDHAAMARLPRVEIAEAGIPCSGQSKSGRAKLGLSVPEAHPEVGHLIVAALVIIARVNPAIVLLECVPQFASSGSAAILRSQLRDLGYNTHETVLNGRDFNALEARERWFMAAVTDGMHFDWEMLQYPEKRTTRLSDVLDDIPDNSPLWSEMAGLKAKQARDIAAGKGFLMQIFRPEDARIATVTKGYARVRSTDPKIAHPTNPDLLRQLTPAEHSRIKQHPPRLIEGLANTIAHEVLGQSVVRDPIVAMGEAFGRSIYALASGEQPPSAAALFEAVADQIKSTASLTVSELRQPLANVKYVGPITVLELGSAIQDIGNGVGIVHRASAVQGARLGELVTVQYPSTRAAPTVKRHDTPAPDVSEPLRARLRVEAQATFDFAPEPETSSPIQRAPRLG